MKWTGLVSAVLALVAGAAPPVVAAECNVKDKAPATARILAKTSDQGVWTEYKSEQDLPDLILSGGMTALVALKKSGSVTIVKPGQSFSTYTRYCYGGDGKLEGVGFEVRTQLGWGYRMEGDVLQGAFTVRGSEFFRTKDGKAIPRPEGVAAAPLGLHPAIYSTLGELPFAALLRTAAPRGKQRAALAPASAGN